MALPQGYIFNIGLYREKHEKIFLSETVRPRALIFGMNHHLVDLFTKFIQIMPLGPKLPRTGDHMFYIGSYKEKHEKIFLSETISSRGARDSKIGKKWPESSRILDYILS